MNLDNIGSIITFVGVLAAVGTGAFLGTRKGIIVFVFMFVLVGFVNLYISEFRAELICNGLLTGECELEGEEPNV